MVGNCYLIRHAQGWMIWDTGVSDDVAAMPNGRPGTDGSPHWRRSKTLAGEIEKLGVKPADIKYLAVSHTHPDHVGNVELFPQTMLLVQKAEYDWPSPTRAALQAGTSGDQARRRPRRVRRRQRDHHLDAGAYARPSVLLVKLPKFGAVLLTGDAVHIQESWEKRYVPSNNVDREKSLASYQRIADLIAQHKAKLWINHDEPQRATLKLAPDYYE